MRAPPKPAERGIARSGAKRRGMLGVCWYPEQWPREMWDDDLRRMGAMGLEYVRVGAYCWALVEPREGARAWDLLDDAVRTATSHGLKVVLAVPTATPPRWLTRAAPEMLSVDARGHLRYEGGRRYACPSSKVYRARAAAIADALAERYAGRVACFQVDTAYGEHDTVRCWCAGCGEAFVRWLRARYQTVEALNDAWGTSAWGQQLGAFEEVERPLDTVGGHHPALLLDHRRFASDQIADFHRTVCEAVRRHAPSAVITHAFAGVHVDLDRSRIEVDVASSISRPLPWSQRLGLGGDARTGHPDVAAFHHDLHRGRGRWWVMEQQCGVAAGAARNVLPAVGMVRLWTWEALAHGAEVVSYARWRTPHAGQEQMEAGLVRADDVTAEGNAEAWRVGRELDFVRLGSCERAPVALVFDVEAQWVFDIQPFGEGLDYLSLVFRFYEALRRLGLDVDVVGPHEAVAHALVVAPSLPIWKKARSGFLRERQAMVVGPRTCSRTPTFRTDLQGLGEERGRLRPVRCETPMEALQGEVSWEGRTYPGGPWRDWLEGDTLPVARFDDGDGAVYEADGLHWIAFWPSVDFLMDYLEKVCERQGIGTVRLSERLRLRRRGDLTFAFNYDADVVDVPAPAGAAFLLGSRDVAGHSVTAWRMDR